MVLTRDEIMVLIRYYKNYIKYANMTIDILKDPEESSLMDPDVRDEQIDKLINNCKAYKHRIEKLKNADYL